MLEPIAPLPLNQDPRLCASGLSFLRKLTRVLCGFLFFCFSSQGWALLPFQQGKETLLRGTVQRRWFEEGKEGVLGLFINQGWESETFLVFEKQSFSKTLQEGQVIEACVEPLESLFSARVRVILKRFTPLNSRQDLRLYHSLPTSCLGPGSRPSPN